VLLCMIVGAVCSEEARKSVTHMKIIIIIREFIKSCSIDVMNVLQLSLANLKG
jgi:hypothetical protein